MFRGSWLPNWPPQSPPTAENADDATNISPDCVEQQRPDAIVSSGIQVRTTGVSGNWKYLLQPSGACPNVELMTPPPPAQSIRPEKTLNYGVALIPAGGEIRHLRGTIGNT